MNCLEMYYAICFFIFSFIYLFFIIIIYTTFEYMFYILSKKKLNYCFAPKLCINFGFHLWILKSLFFVPELWKYLFLHMNFIPKLFSKITKFMCKKKKKKKFKVQDEKWTFQSSRTKNKLHAKFRDENDIFTKKKYMFIVEKTH